MPPTASKQVHELRRDSLGLPSTIAVSLSFIAPTIGALFITQQIAGQAGASTPFIFIMGAIALSLSAATFAEFSKRLPSANILYTSVAKGLGPSTSFVMGLLLLLVYGAVSVANIGLFGGFASDVFKARLGLAIPWWAFDVILVTAIGVFAWFSTKASMKFDLVLLAFELIITCGLFAKIVLSGGDSGQDLSVLGPGLSPTGLSGLGLGFVYVALAFFGFEACTTVAEETQNPRRNVPIALIGSIVIAGVFFVFASYGTIIGFGVSHMDKLVASSAPISDLAGRYIGPGYQVAIDAAGICAISAVMVSVQNANARVWFALSRGNVIPKFLSQVHPQHKTPTAAIALFSVVSLAAGIVATMVWGSNDTFGILGYLSGLGILPIYLMPNIALTCYMWKQHRAEFSWIRHLVLPAISSLIMIVALIFTVDPLPAGPSAAMPFVLGGYVLLSIGWVLWLRKTDPKRVALVGETIFVTTEDLVAEVTHTLAASTPSQIPIAQQRA